MVRGTASENLLNAKEMAGFARDGFIILEDIVPTELNESVHKDEELMMDKGLYFWHASEAIRDVFNLPSVAGIIESLVGKGSTYDHSFLHTVKPGHLRSQSWHSDTGTLNLNPFIFDLQAFYFAHDTPLEMGPTLVLPGSHLRRIDYQSISRYKNITGQKHLVCKAGTIAFMHQDIWHCAQPNATDAMRYVFKIRYNPVVHQRNLFNTEGYDSPEIMEILSKNYPWFGSDWQKEALIKKKFWDELVGRR